MRFFSKIFIFLDPFFALLALIGSVAIISRRAMVGSVRRLPLTRWMFEKMGYLPIRDHYYEPLTFKATGSIYRARVAKLLFDEQRDHTFLESIARPEEFKREYESGVLLESGFRFNNGSFDSGDAEALYYFVRGVQPKRIVEIGAGSTSRIINAALKLNALEGKTGEHVIIEPYENSWLEKLGCRVIRERVEHVDFSIFENLTDGDIVFIDSSHVLRPQNDCVFEYTELLPSLPSGVIVHIHDVFSPFDYPDDWVNKNFYLWTEQYLVEALLLNGASWEILAPLHWLSQDTQEFKVSCPFFEEGRRPGSIWIKKR